MLEPDWDDLDEIDLDELIAHITVDAYGDEGYWSETRATSARPSRTTSSSQ